MQYALEVKNNVRNLRKRGISLLGIHKKTNVPVSTITTWIRDIHLSSRQKEVLLANVQKTLQEGRIKAQNRNKQVRKKKLEFFLEEGKKEIDSINERELFFMGITLYWGEGFKNKHEHRLGFCNSDINMIDFYIYWLEKCLKVKKERLILRLSLNDSCKENEEEIKQFWSKKLDIPITQFTKTFYQHTNWKKQYEDDNYHGVLRVHVKDSLDLLWKMKGWLEGVKMIKYPHLPG